MKDPAIVLHQHDNVATAISQLQKGQILKLPQLEPITVQTDIPFGHKIATAAIRAGAEVIKYGEVIGIAREDIPPGGYVHTHNIESQRGRGDLPLGGGS